METPEDDEGGEWQELTLVEFLKGYAESDAIYDDYSSHRSKDLQEPRAGSD